MLDIFKFWSPPRLSSSLTSERRPGCTRSPLGPGSSKADYAHGLNPYGTSTSRGLAQSYYDDDHDLPPSYSPPRSCARLDDRPAGVTTSTPYNSRYSSDSAGESPLKALENYDIVIVFDDSYSMLNKDRGRTRWDQVRDCIVPDLYPPLSWRILTNVSTRFRRGMRLQLWSASGLNTTEMGSISTF